LFKPLKSVDLQRKISYGWISAHLDRLQDHGLRADKSLRSLITCRFVSPSLSCPWV